MAEFVVEVTSRPLGVRFAHADEGAIVVVHLLKPGGLGEKLGLKQDVVIISVNDKTVLDMQSVDALAYFRKQTLPFKARFRRFLEERDSLSEDPPSEEEEEVEENTEVSLIKLVPTTPTSQPSPSHSKSTLPHVPSLPTLTFSHHPHKRFFHACLAFPLCAPYRTLYPPHTTTFNKQVARS